MKNGYNPANFKYSLNTAKYDPANIAKSTDKVKIIKDKIKFEKFHKKQYHIVKAFDELLPRLPEDGEFLRIVTQLRFNSYVILEYMLGKMEADEIYITSYRMGRYVVEAVDNMARDGILVTIVLSSFFKTKKVKDAAVEMLIYKTKSNKNLRVIFCRNHAKVVSIRSDKGYYTIMGSGNMTGNSKIEEYYITKSKEDYEFTKSWILSIKDNQDKNNYITYNI